MKEKIFIDTDVILDVVFERRPFFHDSQRVLSLIEKNYFIGFTSSLILLLISIMHILLNRKIHANRM